MTDCCHVLLFWTSMNLCKRITKLRSHQAGVKRSRMRKNFNSSLYCNIRETCEFVKQKHKFLNGWHFCELKRMPPAFNGHVFCFLFFYVEPQKLAMPKCKTPKRTFSKLQTFHQERPRECQT